MTYPVTRCRRRRCPATAVAAMVLCLALLPGALRAAGTKTWNTTAGAWSTDGNWTPVGAPAAGDQAVITNTGASVLLAGPTPALGSLTLSKVLTFTNWTTALNATNVTILSGGTMTLPGAFASGATSNRVYIVCSNLVINAGGIIDVTARGYNREQGPGKGTASSYGGGGYGGAGGLVGGDGGQAYGSTNAPLAPGSGGGSATPGAAGAGGGAVRIDATGTVTVNGTIQAQGGNSTHYGGGGSGGAIYITCRKFGGSTNGLLSVAGGEGCWWSGYSAYLAHGGGGGRIAVDYNSLDTAHGVRFVASPGMGWSHASQNYNAFPVGSRPGTVWLADASLLAGGTLKDGLFTEVVLTIPGFTSWAVGSLSVSNCSVTMAQKGFAMTVTNAARINHGYIGIYGNLIVRNGDLILTNGAGLYVYASPTNGAGPDYGARVSVTGDIRIAASSWIYPVADPTNGATVLLRMNTLAIAAGGGINADGRGYQSNRGPGAAGIVAQGGAGHGGSGNVAGSAMGPIYGTTNTPVQPGSGGGLNAYGGYGGGAVRIVAANAATVDGTISANGLGNLSTGAGCGSGGSINIECATLGGGGLLRAIGGSGTAEYPTWWYGGAGGGGRIAVHYTSLATPHTIRFNTSGGAGTERKNPNRIRLAAGNGTAWLPDKALLSETLAGNLFTGVRLFIPGFTSWAVDHLTVSNCSVTFPDTGFALTVTNALQIGANGAVGVLGSIVVSQGDLVLTNGGKLYMYAGPTNTAPAAAGASVAVAGNVTVGPSSWIYPTSHESNGGSVRFTMRNLTVSTNAGFDADMRGYSRGRGPGGGGNNTGRGGGGYGGRGGDYGAQTGGSAYGPRGAPMAPGSSGGYSGGLWEQCPHGGGLVWIEATSTVTLNGTITANGAVAGGSSAAGSSGGGILISCRKFRGGTAASLKAEGKGANTGWLPAWYGGGGGGGRIAVWQKMRPEYRTALMNNQPVPTYVAITNTPFEDYKGTVSATNGIGWETSTPTTNDDSRPGTVAFVDVVFPGMVFMSR